MPSRAIVLGVSFAVLVISRVIYAVKYDQKKEQASRDSSSSHLVKGGDYYLVGCTLRQHLAILLTVSAVMLAGSYLPETLNVLRLVAAGTVLIAGLAFGNYLNRDTLKALRVSEKPSGDT